MTALATDLALAEVVNALIAGDTMKYLGWGGGSGQGESDTDLAVAHGEDRISGGASAETTNTAGDTYRVTGIIVATDARTVTEVGVFTAPTGAVMQLYGDFPAIALAGGDSITFTIDVVIDQG